jgi:hypothetical protein
MKPPMKSYRYSTASLCSRRREAKTMLYGWKARSETTGRVRRLQGAQVRPLRECLRKSHFSMILSQNAHVLVHARKTANQFIRLKGGKKRARVCCLLIDNNKPMTTQGRSRATRIGQNVRSSLVEIIAGEVLIVKAAASSGAFRSMPQLRIFSRVVFGFVIQIFLSSCIHV